MKNVITFWLALITISSFSQDQITYFGIQVKPIIPSNLFRAGDTEIVQDNSIFRVEQNVGYTFGGIIRHDFKNWLSIESGISYVKRNYTAYVIDGINNQTSTASLGIIGYEIPIMGLIYVKLADQIFMDAGFGLAFDIFPSDVYNTDNNNFEFYGFRKTGLNTGLITNVGWEYRTVKKGSIYIGGSFQRPFIPIYQADLALSNGTASSRSASLNLSGNYLTIDFRYFFPGEKKEKKDQLNLKEENLPSWMKAGKK